MIVYENMYANFPAGVHSMYIGEGINAAWLRAGCATSMLQCVKSCSLSLENEEPAVIIPLGYAADDMKPKNRKTISQILG